MKGGLERQSQLNSKTKSNPKTKFEEDLKEFRDSSRSDIIAHTLNAKADREFFAEVLNDHFNDTFDRIELLDDSNSYKLKMINHLSDIHKVMKGRLNTYKINQESEKNSNIGMFQSFEERLNVVLVNAGQEMLDNTTHESSLRAKLLADIKDVSSLQNTININQSRTYYPRIAASAYLKAYFSELKSIKLAIKDGKPIKSNIEGLQMLFDSLSAEHKKKFERFNPNKSADFTSKKSNTDIKEMISGSIDQILQDLSKSINDFDSNQRNEKSSKQSSAKNNVQNNNLNNNSSINRTKNLSKQKPNSSNNRASNPIGEGFEKGVNRVVGENTKNINTSPTDSNSIKPLETNAKSEETKNATSTQNNVIINNQNNTEENNMRSSGNLTQEQFEQDLDKILSLKTNGGVNAQIKDVLNIHRDQPYFKFTLRVSRDACNKIINRNTNNSDEIKEDPQLAMALQMLEFINKEIGINENLNLNQLKTQMEKLKNIALSDAGEQQRIEAVSQINDYVNHCAVKGADFVRVINDATQSLVAQRDSFTKTKGKDKGKGKEGENLLIDALDQLVEALNKLPTPQELNQNNVNSINNPSIQPTTLSSTIPANVVNTFDLPAPLRSTVAQTPVAGSTPKTTNARASQPRNGRLSASQTLINATNVPNKTTSPNVILSQTANSATREQNIGSAQTSASQAQTSSAQITNTTSQSQVIDSAQSQQTRDLASTNAQINQTNVNLDNQLSGTEPQANSQQPIDNSSDEDFSLTLNGDKLFDSENINNQSLPEDFSQQQRTYDPSIDDDNSEDLSEEERTDSASVTNQKSGRSKPRNLINLNSSDDEFEEQSNQVNEQDLQLSEDELEALNGTEEFEDLQVDYSERGDDLRDDLSPQAQRRTPLEDDSEVGQIIKKSKEYYTEVGINNRSFLKVKQLSTKEPNEPEQDLKYCDTDDERKELIRYQLLSRLKAPNIYTDNNSEDSPRYAKILYNIYEGGGDTLKKAIDQRVNSIYESVWNESNKGPKVRTDKDLNDRIDQEVEQVLLQAYLTKYSYLGVRGRNADSFKPDSEETKALKNKAVDAYQKGLINSNDIKEAFKFEGMKWYSTRSVGRKVTQPFFFLLDAPSNVANKIARNPVRVGMTLTAAVLVASLFVPGAFPLIFTIVCAGWAGAGIIKAVDAMMKNPITKPLFLIPAGILELVAVGIPKGIAIVLDTLISQGSRLLVKLGLMKEPIKPFIKSNLDKVMPKLGDGVEFVKNYNGKKKETTTKNFLEGKTYADEQKAIQQKRSDVVDSLKKLTHHQDITRAMNNSYVKTIIANNAALRSELSKNIAASKLREQQAANPQQPAANAQQAQTTPSNEQSQKRWPEVARDKISSIAGSISSGFTSASSSIGSGASSAASKASDIGQSIKGKASSLYNKLTRNNPTHSPYSPADLPVPTERSNPIVGLPESMRSTEGSSTQISNVQSQRTNALDLASAKDAANEIKEGSSSSKTNSNKPSLTRSASMGDITKNNSVLGSGSSSRSDNFRQRIDKNIQSQNTRG